jgi:hypothetical protein
MILIVAGTVVAVGSVSTAALGLNAFPFDTMDVLGYAIAAVIGTAGLTACVATILLAWLVAHRRSISGGPFVRRGWRIATLVAQGLSYAAVLVAMFGALAASALAGWDSPSGMLLGIAFLLAIFGQILAGTQDLRVSGPPGTVPTYLRRLNGLVQSRR